MTYILAKYAGLEEYDCITVAYSSQYVDNNLVGHRIHTDGKAYETTVTHNYSWWSDWFPLHVYVPFHFFPGDLTYYGARRTDGKRHRLNTTPGGQFVRELARRAFSTGNLYRIGLGLHTLADSWAHQNFTGTNDEWNTYSPNSPIPKVGHADAITAPDAITGKWIDSRLEGEYQYIDNEARFLEAAQCLYGYLCEYTGKWQRTTDPADHPDDWEKVRSRIKYLIGDYDEFNMRQTERINGYILEEELLEYNKYDWFREAVHYNESESKLEDMFKGYDKLAWFKEEFLHKTGFLKKSPLVGRDSFYFSHYFNWHEAAKEHVKDARLILKGVL
ncbi:MAG: hypothetical protein JW904_12040 [Spirochaetales bacterium]|nr:hypothetical protein [Spirochaetales bacterium]